jgi:hypothetical protein
MPLPENPYEPQDKHNLVKLYKFNYNGHEVCIRGNLLTLEVTDILLDKLAEIRAKYSDHAVIPAHEGEDPEEYVKRANKEMELRRMYRPKGESEEEWTKRQFVDKRRQPKILFELLNAVLELVGERPVNESDFRKAPWPDNKNFIFDMLWFGANVYCDEAVSPKSPE